MLREGPQEMDRKIGRKRLCAEPAAAAKMAPRYGIPCAVIPSYHVSAMSCEPAGFGWHPSLV